MRMEKTKAVIDADFYIKLTEYAQDKRKLFCWVMADLNVRPVMHKYVADVELKKSTSLQELIAGGAIDIVDYDAYIDRENDENYREYFKLAYEKMNRYDFPENQDIYTYHCIDENLGEIRSIYMAMRMNCMYFMSDDSGARSFVKNTFTSKKRLETMSVYDALKKCCDLKTSISLKQLNPVIHQIFREQQDRLKKLQEMYKEKDMAVEIQ